MAHRHLLRSALSALTIGGMLALCACGGDSAAAPPTADATRSPTPTVDTRPSPASSTAPARNISVPELPQAATQNTKEGFKAFVEHYIALLDYAYQTGDTKPAVGVADPGCSMCNTVAKRINEVTSGGGWMTGGRLTIKALATDGIPDISGRWDAQLTLTQAEVTNVARDGRADSPEPAASAGLLAVAEYVDGKWSMFDLGVPRGAHG